MAPPDPRAAEIADLRARLAEAEQTLDAIRHGEVDALVIADEAGDRVYTLRNADTPYRYLVEQMQEGAAMLTAGGGIVFCNRRFAELVGSPLEQVIGRPIDTLVEGEDLKAVQALLTAGAGQLRTRLRGTDRAVDALISVSRVVVDNVDHRVLIVADMTQLARAQRESRSKDEFLAMLAHELRNPLGAIGSAVQVLQMGRLDQPQAARARDVIQRQTTHMARLVDDLLDVGRVMTGKIVLSRRRIDLAESVRASVGTVAAGRGAGAIEVTAEPVWIDADLVRLEQIVGNLVSNAVKFTPPGAPIRVSVGRDGRDAVLRVEDQGIGIDADLLPRVFDLFVQADDTMDRARGGMGIGLTLVKQLVELHGGSVAASSDGAGRGAVFTVRLPAVEAAGAPGATEPAARPASAPRRVLLVDDHADSRTMYSVILKADGHEIFEAADGEQALAVFRAVRPDVAVVDIGLPGMDGYELARRIRREPGGESVRLIALTGYGFPEDRERTALAGFDRHLVKPAPPDRLRHELVATALSGEGD